MSLAASEGIQVVTKVAKLSRARPSSSSSEEISSYAGPSPLPSSGNRWCGISVRLSGSGIASGGGRWIDAFGPASAICFLLCRAGWVAYQYMIGRGWVMPARTARRRSPTCRPAAERGQMAFERRAIPLWMKRLVAVFE